MSLFLVVIGTIIVVEVVYRLRLKYRQCRIEIVATVTESVKTLRSKKIPDSSKEKVLRRYTVKLFIQSLILFGLIFLTVSPLGVIVTVNSLNGGSLLQFLLTVGGIFLSILSATIYGIVRKLVSND